MPTMTPQALTRTVQDFLSDAADAMVLENGAVAFDLAQSKYSISGEHNRCLLHLWSPERNAVRRVLEAEVKNGTLRLAVQRLGQARPSKLEICRERDRRSPTARRASRAAFEQKLRRTLERHFPEFKITRLTGGVDLEKSFGPVYTRGIMRQGRSAFALLGVNARETQSSIDAALTFGILWLDVCRQAQAANVLVEGLKIFVPNGTSALVRERMANLNRDAAKWSLFELEERHDALVEIDCADRGNVATRLVHAADEGAARERFKESIAKVQEVCRIAKSACFRRRKLFSAGADWSLPERDWEPFQDRFAVWRRLCLAWERRNGCWRVAMKLPSRNLPTACATCVILTDRASIRYGGSVQRDGLIRWWPATWRWWMGAWIRRAAIRRFQHFPQLTVP